MQDSDPHSFQINQKIDEHAHVQHQNVDLKMSLLLLPAGVDSFMGTDCSKGFC